VVRRTAPYELSMNYPPLAEFMGDFIILPPNLHLSNQYLGKAACISWDAIINELEIML